MKTFKELREATYKGKTVPLNKPMAGDVKKRKVYVDPEGDGKAKKVEFGDTTGLTIKTSDPDRRKNFRARHNCDTPGPKDKARYWSCKAWSAPTVKQGLGTENYVVERFSRQELKKYNEIHKNNKLKDLSRKENKLFNDYKHADFQDNSKPHDVENYHPESALLNGFLKHHYDNSYEGTRYSHPDQNPSEKIKAMDDVLKRHKTDREMSVYTGIRSAPKTDENGHAHLPGYTSTSLDPSVANDFASEKSDSDEETHMLHIKLPAGSHAASMHYIGGRDREHEHEHEILMARGYTVKIHPVPKIVEDSFGATKHHIWHATVVKHEPKNLTENYNSKHKKLLTQSHVTIHFGDKEVKIHLDNTNRGMKPADKNTNKDKSSERKIPMLDTVFGES